MKVKESKNQRFWELDFLRGIAIILMILFHFLYDLNFFNIYKISLYSGFFLIYAYVVGSVFIMLVGISLSLSYNRIKNDSSKRQIIKKFSIRGLKIFGLGLIISLATWLYLKDGYIIFGVLHLIGISIIISTPFLKLKNLNLIIGIVLISIGIILKSFIFDFYWLMWLGFTPKTLYTVDYYPLLPWFGVVLIGIFVGNNFYPDYKRIISVRDLSVYKPVKFFSFLGKNSLIIYFLHQPILIAIIHLLLI
jgi:uncharacterized membrane protein